MGRPLIRTEHLSVIYNQGKSNEVRSLWDVGVEIYPEEFVIIHGPSGCGKSTLMYSIASLQMPTDGEVYIADRPLSKFTKKEKLDFRRTGMGMIFQAFYLIDTLSVVDNVCLPKLFRSEDKQERREAAMKLLIRFGIGAQAQRYPSQLSGGQKQRVAISRALVNAPDLILADEPVGNLDSESARTVLEILKELNERDKKTIVLVTHDPNHLVYGDHIIHMKDGQVLKDEIRKDKRGINVGSGKGDGEQDAQNAAPKPEDISPQLAALLRVFRDLPSSHASALLMPLKAKHLMFHILSGISEDQWESGQHILEERLQGLVDSKSFLSLLDASVALGGANWNRLRAQSFVERSEYLIGISSLLNNEPSPERGAVILGDAIERLFDLRLDPAGRSALREIFLNRITCAFGYDEVREWLDRARINGGLGLRQPTAERIAREVEMIFLIKY